MHSFTINDRGTFLQGVASATYNNAHNVGQRLAGDLSQFLGDAETMPDAAQLQTLLARALEHSHTRMLEWDKQRILDLADIQIARENRDTRAAEMRTMLTRVRSAVDGIFGLGTCERALGLSGKIAVNPGLLHTQADTVLKRLREPADHFPVASLLGFSVDWEPWIANIEAGLANLKEGIHQFASKRDVANATRQERNREKAHFDLKYRGILKVMRGFFLMTGNEELADRLRPSRVRRGPRDGDAGDAPAESGAEDATAVDGSAVDAAAVDKAFEVETPSDGEVIAH